MNVITINPETSYQTSQFRFLRLADILPLIRKWRRTWLSPGLAAIYLMGLLAVLLQLRSILA